MLLMMPESVAAFSLWYGGGCDKRVFEPIFGVAFAVPSLRRTTIAFIPGSRLSPPVPIVRDCQAGTRRRRTRSRRRFPTVSGPLRRTFRVAIGDWRVASGRLLSPIPFSLVFVTKSPSFS